MRNSVTGDTTKAPVVGTISSYHSAPHNPMRSKVVKREGTYSTHNNYNNRKLGQWEAGRGRYMKGESKQNLLDKGQDFEAEEETMRFSLQR